MKSNNVKIIVNFSKRSLICLKPSKSYFEFTFLRIFEPAVVLELKWLIFRNCVFVTHFALLHYLNEAGSTLQPSIQWLLRAILWCTLSGSKPKSRKTEQGSVWMYAWLKIDSPQRQAFISENKEWQLRNTCSCCLW